MGKADHESLVPVLGGGWGACVSWRLRLRPTEALCTNGH